MFEKGAWYDGKRGTRVVMFDGADDLGPSISFKRSIFPVLTSVEGDEGRTTSITGIAMLLG